MAALNFPDPNVQTSYTNPNTGITYEWSNGIWKAARTAQTAPELFVDADGDNLTGNLTLGTDKIVLNATDGSATFAGGLAEIEATGNYVAATDAQGWQPSIDKGGVLLSRSGSLNVVSSSTAAANSDIINILRHDTSSSGVSQKATIKADGSATFASNVGIGTTSPSLGLLEVSSTNGVTLAIKNTTGTATGTEFCQLTFNNTSNSSANFESAKIKAISTNGGANLAHLTFETSGTEQMRIDSSGRLLVGMSSAPGSTTSTLVVSGNTNGSIQQGELQLNNGATPIGNNYGLGVIRFSGETTGKIAAQIQGFADADWNTGGDTTDNPGRLVFAVTADGASSPTERMRIDSSGRLLVGTSGARSNFNNNIDGATLVQLEGTTYGTSALSITRNSNDPGSPTIEINKTRGTSNGQNTIVANGDPFGFINFAGTDGTNSVRGASISAWCDGTPSTGDMPGRLVLATTADGESSPTERMRIDSAGNVGIGTSSPQAINGYTVLTLNNSTQGGAIEFKRSNTSYGRLLQASDAVILETKQNIPLVFGTGNVSTERMRITSSGELLVGRTNEANMNVNIACANAFIGAHFIGMAHYSTNSNNRTTLVHKMNTDQGFMFSGNLVVQSWTGNAFITVHVTKIYNSDAIEVDIIHATHSAQMPRSNVRVVTAKYGSEIYLGFQKAGGGTGVMYINAFLNGNIDLNGGVREVNNTSLGDVTEIARLNY